MMTVGATVLMVRAVSARAAEERQVDAGGDGLYRAMSEAAMRNHHGLLQDSGGRTATHSDESKRDVGCDAAQDRRDALWTVDRQETARSSDVLGGRVRVGAGAGAGA
jgi:hypothetical protein